jgi:ribose-phosphate pyrophosphokinase
LAKLKVFAGSVGTALAKDICARLSIPLGNIKLGRFADGEVRVQILDDVRDCDIFIVNPTNPPAENLLEMVLIAEAIRGSSAGRITLVPTYLGYSRQDRKDRPRVPISARVIISMLSLSGADRVLLFDLHSEPTIGYFNTSIVSDHLYASPIMVPYLKEVLGHNYIVASPDKGGGPRAEAYARRLGQEDYVLFTKSRPQPGEVDSKLIKIIGEVDGKDILFVDDMIDTAGTVIADAEAARRAGAKDIYVCATHALFSGSAIDKINASPIKQVIVTDSIHHNSEAPKEKTDKIIVLSIAPLIAEAIRRIHDGESLAPLIT